MRMFSCCVDVLVLAELFYVEGAVWMFSCWRSSSELVGAARGADLRNCIRGPSMFFVVSRKGCPTRARE